MMSKRTLIFACILATGLFVIDFFLSKFSREERKTQIVLELIQSDKILSSELYRLFYGLEDDFNFFERKFKSILNRKRSGETLETLLEFLNTHPHYLKVRLTKRGKEILKIVQRQDRTSYEESQNLFDLSEQSFFNELKQVGFNDFYFSSMEANVINGKTERPIRPTIRVSKRIMLDNQRDALLIFNIDGHRILQLFEAQPAAANFINVKALVDHEGFHVASHPVRTVEKYTLDRIKIEDSVLVALNKSNELHGSLETKDGVLVYTKLPLPRSSEKWFLISKFSEQSLNQLLYRERLTRLFWESLCFIVLVFWFWRDEKKRHKEQVVQVLLKERSEFIQNVSHQLKTPLAIIYNDLSQTGKLLENHNEIQKEVEHLIKVVEDLLLLSQIDSLRKIPIVKENVLEILNETIDLVGVKAKEKSISIRVTIQEELTERLDLLVKDVLPDLLKSAFFNLLDNAIDFSPPNELIQISFFFVGPKIIIKIEDRGPGVPEQLIPTLFSPYTRDQTIKRKGTGLGLSISKKIIELHKGEIHYVHCKQGATFQIIL